MPSPVDIPCILQNKLPDKQFRRVCRNLIDRQNKTMTAKTLPKKRNFNLNQTSRLISRNQKEVTRVLPLRGILKNQKGGTSVKKDKTIGDAQGRNFIKLCCEPAKHVSFSGKDDILSLNKRHSPMELPHLQNLCKIFSDILAASSAMDNWSKVDKCPTPTEGAQGVNSGDTDLARSVERTNGTLSEEKQLSDSCGHCNPWRFTDPRKGKSPETKGTPLCESVELNYAVQDCSKLSCFQLDGSTMSHTDAYSGNAKDLNPICEAKSNCDAGAHGEESSQMTADDIRNQHSPTEKCVPRSKVRSSLTLTGNPGLQHSTSSMEKGLEANKGQHPPCVDSTIDFCSQQPRFQPVRHHSPECLMSSISSSVGSKEFGESKITSDLMSRCREKSIDEDFIGLPLNSQGELMQLHSNTKSAYGDFYKKQNSVRNSVCSVPLPNYAEPNCSHVKLKGKVICASLYQKDRSNWSLERYYPTSKAATSGLGFTDLQGFVRMEIQNHKDFEQLTHCDPNEMEVSCCICRECNKTENYIDRVNFHSEMKLDNKFQPATQQMMRLMGQNVAVGRSNEECLGFNDGKTWTEKELIAQNCPSMTGSGKPILQRWLLRESVENAESVSSTENFFKSLEVPSRFYSMPATEFRSNPMHLDFQPQRSSGSEISPAIESHGYDVDLFGHSVPQHLLKKTYNDAVNCNSGSQHDEMGHQQPVLGSYPQNVNRHPACPDQDRWSFSRTSIAHSPTLPHWLLNATQQKKLQQSSCPFSAPLSAHQPSVIHGNNVFTFSSPYPTPAISFPFYGSNSLPGPAPVVHHLAIPALGAKKAHPAVKKNENVTKFQFVNVKGLDRTSRTRKRPADKGDTSMHSAKKVNLNLQEDSTVRKDTGSREQRHGHQKCNMGSSEINACGSKITDVGLPALGNAMDNLVVTSWPDAPNFYPQGRTGFVKLGAGARHILKPCRNMDQDKSRSVHSTVRLAVATSSRRKHVSRNKAPKVAGSRGSL
ncbi:hypothetical protein COCNU_03G014120 [Cocos nucifera]|uniref:Uncharacterized protein n=1 Tax=Cocos nucifera TaxID=13894 RepID=A0A8K0MZ98_COCNU|nr:hypothetical protein COCNU_03G014120 [Cocos nucifera]